MADVHGNRAICRSSMDRLKLVWYRFLKEHHLVATACMEIIFLLSISASAQDSSVSNTLLTTNSAFVRYLEAPPWIKNMTFVVNAFWQAGPEPGKETWKGWVETTNRIAVQPSGMYFEPLNPNPTPLAPPTSPTQVDIQGISERYYWQANLDEHALSTSPQRADEGGSEDNRLQSLLRLEQEYAIQPVRYFGFPPLRPGSFHLTAQNRFVAVTTGGESLSGEVLDAYDNRPIKLRYSMDNDKNNYVLVTYRYGSGELPDYFERHQPANRYKHARNKTNWILSANYGLDPNIHNGYSPSMFFSNLAIFTHIFLESNGQRYILMPNGQAKRTSGRYTLLPQLGSVQPQQRNIVRAILIVFLVGSGFFIWKVVRRQRR